MNPKTMKAVLLTGPGGPEKLEFRSDVARPEPAEGEVLVRVGACGINNTDIWTRLGLTASGLSPEQRRTGPRRRCSSRASRGLTLPG